MSGVFFEICFPSVISRGASAVVRSRTSVFTTGGGQERRMKRWAGPLRNWDAARGIRNTSDLEVVRAFHIVMGGRHAGFRFKDFSDYRATDEMIDTSVVGSTFQLRRGYVAGDVTQWRKITKPVKGTTRLFLNGDPAIVLEDGQSIDDYLPLFGEQLFGVNIETTYRFTLDTTTGALTSILPAMLSGADSLRASFEFDVPARFGSDDFEVRAHSRGRNWEYSNLPVKELRR